MRRIGSGLKCYQHRPKGYHSILEQLKDVTTTLWRKGLIDEYEMGRSISQALKDKEIEVAREFIELLPVRYRVLYEQTLDLPSLIPKYIALDDEASVRYILRVSDLNKEQVSSPTQYYREKGDTEMVGYLQRKFRE